MDDPFLVPPILVPTRVARHMLGDIGNSKFYEMVAAGDLDIVKIGRKSAVKYQQVVALAERLAAEASKKEAA